MASSTRGELIPRSRICSYTMARRCSRNSAAARGVSRAGLAGLPGPPFPGGATVRGQGPGSSGGRRVPLPRALGGNFFDMREGGVDFVVAVVKVRGTADARLRAVVHQDVAGQQLAGDLARVRAIHGNRAGSLSGVHGRVHAPTAGERAFDYALGLPHGLRADALDADCADDLEAWLAGIKRGDMRRAVQVTEGVFAAVDGTHFKFKRPLVREPAGERGLELCAQVRADVKVPHAGPAAEPLQDAADGEIGAKLAHVDRNGARSLEKVQDDERADAVRAFEDCARVHDARAAEQYVGDGHQQRLLVNRGEELLERDADAVFAFDDFDARATTLLLLIKIENRGELHVHHDHFVARAAKVEAGRDHRLGKRDVLMQGDVARRRSDQRPDAVAHADRHVPPAFFPGAYATRGPGVGVFTYAVVDAARHRAQRVADHVGGAGEDGKLLAPLQQLIHRYILRWVPLRLLTEGINKLPHRTSGGPRRTARTLAGAFPCLPCIIHNPNQLPYRSPLARRYILTEYVRQALSLPTAQTLEGSQRDGPGGAAQARPRKVAERDEGQPRQTGLECDPHPRDPPGRASDGRKRREPAE